MPSPDEAETRASIHAEGFGDESLEAEASRRGYLGSDWPAPDAGFER